MHSVLVFPNSAVIWVLAMSPMPKSSIDKMSHFGTVPRAQITTDDQSLHDGFSLPQILDPDTSQLSSPLF